MCFSAICCSRDRRGQQAPAVVLDQVTDPHNIGAVLRSAAAFDAAAIVTQDRHSPPESGVIARSASGALEIVPWVRVVNLSRALEEIAEAQYWRIGLMGDTETTLGSTLDGSRVALVLGSEGDGMRHNVMEHCDVLAKLPISPRMESLNISNAAAVALYAVATAANKRRPGEGGIAHVLNRTIATVKDCWGPPLHSFAGAAGLNPRRRSAPSTRPARR
jgi:23S rRNA (guanosine2251-2'-O)-methyltransferase